MTVEKAKQKIKCDASSCKNVADYCILNKKFIFDGSFYLCTQCMQQLYAEIGKFIVPKNIKPLYKKGAKDEQKF